MSCCVFSLLESYLKSENDHTKCNFLDFSRGRSGKRKRVHAVTGCSVVWKLGWERGIAWVRWANRTHWGAFEASMRQQRQHVNTIKSIFSRSLFY